MVDLDMAAPDPSVLERKDRVPEDANEVESALPLTFQVKNV